MNTEKIPWHLIAGLVLGLGLGLIISWVIAPSAYTVTSPANLRSDYKASYRALIASAYAATGNMPRTELRLVSLEDENTVEALTVQAQRELAIGNIQASEALALLAANLQGNPTVTDTTPPTQFIQPATPRNTHTPTPASDQEDETENVPEEPIPTLTNIPENTRTPAPTSTPIPTVGAPYVLVTQDEICTTTISEGLLMVFVTDAAQRPVPGVEVIVEWSGKEEHFFTGLKPELGMGYADFTMQPNQIYALRLATGSTAAGNLTAPACQDKEGNHYWGSLRLGFQRP